MLKHEIADGRPSVWERIKKLRVNDICTLAPEFRYAIERMQNDWKISEPIVQGGKTYPFDPVIFETTRVNELQRIYFDQGTSGAQHAFYSWHFYGLAIDVVSASMEWSAPAMWWTRLGDIANNHGLRWGGNWPRKDLPHIQWGAMLDTPQRAPYIYFGATVIQRFERFEDEMMHREGLMRVWKAVQAI